MATLNRFLLFIFFLHFLQFLSAPPLLAGDGKLLVFGRFQDDPVRAIKDRQEFVDYVAKKLAPVGITGGKILVLDKLHLLARAIQENKVDFFHDSVVPTLVLTKWSGSVPILRQWKYGESEYYSVILVRKDSRIDTVGDLKGKVIAFDDPASTSAHILPRMLLAEKKLKLVQMISPEGSKPDEVGFVYGADGSSSNRLIIGQVDAAATSFREFEELRPEVQKNLKILAKTPAVPRLLISVRQDLDANLVRALREVLLNMDKDPEGQGVLKRQQRTTKIDEIPPGSLEQFKSIQKFVLSSLGTQIDSW